MMDYKNKVYPMLLDLIDFEGTDKEKLQFVFDCFNNEAGYAYNLQRLKSYQKIFADWLQGLPLSLNLPYYNMDILEFAQKMGAFDKKDNTKYRQKILDNYFDFMANNYFKLFRKYKIEMNFNH